MSSEDAAKILTQLAATQQALTELMTKEQGKKIVKLPTIPEYDGEDEKAYKVWEFRTKNILEIYQVNPALTPRLIFGAMKGKAAAAAKALEGKANSYQTKEDFFKDLKELFLSPANAERCRVEYEKRVQNNKESLREYHSELLHLFNEAFEGGERNKKELLDHFVSGIKDERIREKMHDLKVINVFPQTYTDALRVAMHYEAEKERTLIETKRQAKNVAFTPENNTPAREELEPMDTSSLRNVNQNVNKWERPMNNNVRNDGRTPGNCWNCGKTGHISRNCWSNRNNFEPPVRNRRMNEQTRNISPGFRRPALTENQMRWSGNETGPSRGRAQ